MTTEPQTMTASAPRARRASSATPAGAPAATGKSDTVIKLLLWAKGATTPELIAATGWQQHSVRAFLSVLRKKGKKIEREARKNGDAAYRIVTAPTSPSEVPGTDLEVGVPSSNKVA